MIDKALRVQDHLQCMVAAIDRIDTYTRGFDQAAFIQNTLVLDAVIRNLAVIGEAGRAIQARGFSARFG